MSRYVPVIDQIPCASKKGLRMKINGVDLDKENNLVAMHVDFSGFHERGHAIIEIAQRNKVELPEE